MWQDFSLNQYDPANINGHWELCNEWHSLQTKVNIVARYVSHQPAVINVEETILELFKYSCLWVGVSMWFHVTTGVCACVCVRTRTCLIACIKESMYIQNGKYVENRHFCHHFNFLFYSGFSWICK
jgi:hypothetical protein